MPNKSLADVIVDIATEWADQNQIDGWRTIHLRRHLRTSLEALGFASVDKLGKGDKKRELVAVLK